MAIDNKAIEKALEKMMADPEIKAGIEEAKKLGKEKGPPPEGSYTAKGTECLGCHSCAACPLPHIQAGHLFAAFHLN